MQELLVLGLIPGTNIQITFMMWLVLVIGIVVSIGISMAKRRHTLQKLVVTTFLMLQTRRQPA